MLDTFEEQLARIEAANPNEAAELEPGNGEQEAVEQEAAPEPEGQAPDGDELDSEPDAGAPEGEGSDEPHDKRRRSKPASQRIAELTAKLRDAERKLEAVNAPEPVATEPPARPDPSGFEYGEADPAYIEKLTDWKLETRDLERNKADAERDQQQAFQNRLQVGLAKAEAEAQVKYDDFDARIAEAVEARGGVPLPPIVSVGISTSPVGGDVIYRMATDDAVADRLESLAKSPKAVAMAIGEIEAEYMDDVTDGDLDITDELDMARMLGRMRSRAAGKRAAPPKAEVVLTNAPEPPSNRARGSAGKNTPSPDTDDPKEFMKHYGYQMGR